jgi:hypothetical protein
MILTSTAKIAPLQTHCKSSQLQKLLYPPSEIEANWGWREACTGSRSGSDAGCWRWVHFSCFPATVAIFYRWCWLVVNNKNWNLGKDERVSSGANILILIILCHVIRECFVENQSHHKAFSFFYLFESFLDAYSNINK